MTDNDNLVRDYARAVLAQCCAHHALIVGAQETADKYAIEVSGAGWSELLWSNGLDPWSGTKPEPPPGLPPSLARYIDGWIHDEIGGGIATPEDVAEWTGENLEHVRLHMDYEKREVGRDTSMCHPLAPAAKAANEEALSRFVDVLLWEPEDPEVTGD